MKNPKVLPTPRSHDVSVITPGESGHGGTAKVGTYMAIDGADAVRLATNGSRRPRIGHGRWGSGYAVGGRHYTATVVS